MMRLIKPYIKFADVEEAFKEVFESGILTRGKYVEKFSKGLCEYTGAKYCYLATSATTALSAALKVLDIKPGDEVIVSDFSFPASANVVEELYAIPVFADVDIETYNMLPDELEKKITKKTKAVIFVDALGNPSGLHEIKEICKKHSLPLIEDAACGLGSSEFGTKVGNVADITCLSFHPRKLLTCGEGGAILTNNDEYSKILNVKLAHGAINANGKLEFVDYGYNYRLTELQAVMGLAQLSCLDDIVKSRQKIIEEYISLLSPLLVPQKILKDSVHNVQSIVFFVDQKINRDELCNYLKDKNIETTIGTYCLSACDYYKRKYNNIQKNANSLFLHTITLPCSEETDARVVCDAINSFVKKVVG